MECITGTGIIIQSKVQVLYIQAQVLCNMAPHLWQLITSPADLSSIFASHMHAHSTAMHPLREKKKKKNTSDQIVGINRWDLDHPPLILLLLRLGETIEDLNRQWD